MRKLLRDLFTGKDNTTYDIGRVIAAKLVLTYCGATYYGIYTGKTFDPGTWGAGAAALVGGLGVLLFAKSSTEPDPK